MNCTVHNSSYIPLVNWGDPIALEWGVSYILILSSGHRLPPGYWYGNGVVRYLFPSTELTSEWVEVWLWEE